MFLLGNKFLLPLLFLTLKRVTLTVVLLLASFKFTVKRRFFLDPLKTLTVMTTMHGLVLG